jgi:hypothetical protein
MVIALLVVLGFVISPFAIMLAISHWPKKDKVKIQSQELIRASTHKVSLINKKYSFVYTYEENNLYGNKAIKERFFENECYKKCINHNGSIVDAMQKRINELEKSFPEADVQLTFPE